MCVSVRVCDEHVFFFRVCMSVDSPRCGSVYPMCQSGVCVSSVEYVCGVCVWVCVGVCVCACGCGNSAMGEGSLNCCKSPLGCQQVQDEWGKKREKKERAVHTYVSM